VQTLSIGRKKRIHAIAFTPDGNELAAPCGDFQLRVWDLRTGEVRRSVPIENPSCPYSLLYLDQNRLVFSGVGLSVWDVESNTWVEIARGPWWRRLALSRNGEYLVEVDKTTSTDWAAGGGLLVRETSGWELLPAMPGSVNTTGGVAFSHDDRLLATSHMQHVGQKSKSLGPAWGHCDVPDYEYVVHVREMPSGRVVQTIDGWDQGASNLAFSPDGTFLVGTAGPRLRVWDLMANREVAVHKRGPKHFQGLSFTHDGRYLATVSNDETVRIWDARTWDEHTTYTWKIGALLNISFAPDGLRAAAGSDKGQIVIWDVE
jgi:WD40 repeat protein